MKRISYVLLLTCLAAISARAQGWEAVEGFIPVPLSFPVVVQLNGDIHVMGGGGPSGATDLHLRLKIATNVWDTLAPVPYKAQQPAGAVVDGKIHYFGGGYPNSGSRLDKHYVYNPDSNTWTVAAPLPEATAIHKAASVDGKLYSLSGQPDKTAVWMYDPGTNTWTAKNALPDQNFWYSAIVVVNNELYRFGGGGYTAPVSSAHKYNKANDSWVSLPSMPQAIHALAGSGFGTNFIVLGGGYYNSASTGETWIYDIARQQYFTTWAMNKDRDYHSFVTYNNCIYSLGGNNNTDPQVAVSILRYCPSSNVGVRAVAGNSMSLVPTADGWRVTLPGSAGVVKAMLTDMAGRCVWNATTVTNTHGSFDVSTGHLAPACYLLQVETTDGKQLVQKLPVNVKY